MSIRNWGAGKQAGYRSFGDTPVDGVGFARHDHIELDSETRRAFLIDF
jgi:hypothetical protein